MTIKSFKDWIEGVKFIDVHGYNGMGKMNVAYDAGIEESSKHFEFEKLKIHEYYDVKIKELFGNKNPLIEADEKNGGKLT